MVQPSNNLKDLETVPYHKRIAMGASLDGTSLKSKQPNQTAPKPKVFKKQKWLLKLLAQLRKGSLKLPIL